MGRATIDYFLCGLLCVQIYFHFWHNSFPSSYATVRQKQKTGSTSHTDLHPAEAGQLLSRAPAKRTAGKCLGGSAVSETSPPLAANLSPSETNKYSFFLHNHDIVKKIYKKREKMIKVISLGNFIHM